VLEQAAAEADYVVFFDDDFLPDDRWLEVVVAHFESDPSVAGVTGNVVADGILGPGLTFEEGDAALAGADRDGLDWRVEGYSPYGCNMAYRVAAIGGMRFDERLVLYGWLEDRDFGARVAATGRRLVKLGAALGVHLGVKRGRVSGRRLGYSQIANPSYMRAKGTISRRGAMKSALRNVAANLAKSPWPEPYIDRRGRLWGNALAALDLLKGVCEPERAERL
jgi:GT2 family glycosyltransferase